jgi:hypothetical protein
MLLITGPNMGGKSTYMRQNALIVLLAHVGSFVPAQAARLSLVDRIFTRIGAADDLASGRSTFMVEMTETANILHNASERSLVLMDEIGRGTSTFDGLSLAWAAAVHLAGNCAPSRSSPRTTSNSRPSPRSCPRCATCTWTPWNTAITWCSCTASGGAGQPQLRPAGGQARRRTGAGTERRGERSCASWRLRGAG